MPLDSGIRLGPYEILGPLGAGGMGEVYRARDTRLDRLVAIKVLPADSTSTSPTTIRCQFTVDDPTTWTRPWSGEYEMTRIDGPLFEYACHEGNYGLPSILKGARLAEEAAAKTGSR